MDPRERVGHQSPGEYEEGVSRMQSAQGEQEIHEHPERFDRCPVCGDHLRLGDGYRLEHLEACPNWLDPHWVE